MDINSLGYFFDGDVLYRFVGTEEEKYDFTGFYKGFDVVRTSVIAQFNKHALFDRLVVVECVSNGKSHGDFITCPKCGKRILTSRFIKNGLCDSLVKDYRYGLPVHCLMKKQRLICPKCEKSFVETAPFQSHNMQITYHLECLIKTAIYMYRPTIRMLSECLNVDKSVICKIRRDMNPHLDKSFLIGREETELPSVFEASKRIKTPERY